MRRKSIKTLFSLGHIRSAERAQRIDMARKLAESARRQEDSGLWHAYGRPEGPDDQELKRMGIWYKPYEWRRVTKYGRRSKDDALNACIANIGFYYYQQRRRISENEFNVAGMRYKIRLCEKMD